MNNDSILIEQIANGDETAFIALLDKYESRVFRYFCICFDGHTAEDLAQTVFMSILQKPPQKIAGKQFSHYLFKVCKNTALKEFRRRKLHLEEEITSIDKEQTDFLENEETSTWVYKAIAALSPIQKQAVLLKFIEGFSLEQISLILELPINTVKSHIHRAKKDLRKYLEPYYTEEKT